MGCDGGSIPRRDEMVKLKKKAEKAEKAIELAAKWRYCALRSEKLQQPIVGCELGRLYNKESVLMTLLDKSSVPDNAQHLRSLKDVVVLQLTSDPHYKASDKADAYNDMQTAEFVCPVTGLYMNGQNRFVFFRQCGCVVSEKALKEVPSVTCHKCGKPFVKEDVTIINGTEEEQERHRLSMEERRQAVRIAKRKRKIDHGESSSSTITTTESSSDSSNGMETATPTVHAPSSSLPQAVVVVAKEEPREKKSKIVPEPKPKPVKVASRPVTKAKGHLEKRDAYKSLFTSSMPARPKEKSSHWVTFFPYH